MKQYRFENGLLINADNLDIFSKIKDESIDLILTDPPYNISRKNNYETMGRQSIDFGNWDHDFNQIKWLEKINRIISKNGSVIIFNDWKNMGLIAEYLEKNGFEIKDIIRWKKPNPVPRNIERRYVIDCEYIIWATKKGAKWTFNKNNETYARPEYLFSSPNKRIHPTEKPIGLLKEIIERHSKIGDLKIVK